MAHRLFSLWVFLEWCGLHKLCQFFSSQNSTMSPLCGMTWSTSLAATVLCSSRHSTHNGLRSKYCSLALRQWRSYSRVDVAAPSQLVLAVANRFVSATAKRG